MIRPAAASALLLGFFVPAIALGEPTVWRDPDTGCAYLLTAQGGISPRFRRDGSPDCPNASIGTRLVDDTIRGLTQGLDVLRRELDRLRDRLNDNRHEERL